MGNTLRLSETPKVEGDLTSPTSACELYPSVCSWGKEGPGLPRPRVPNILFSDLREISLSGAQLV